MASSVYVHEYMYTCVHILRKRERLNDYMNFSEENKTGLLEICYEKIHSWLPIFCLVSLA